ncbi:helix-turn-helix transcriptional regulator [Paenibacillus sp. BR2-3]|uniref:transcriptional regulator n=1 Tax=Paenibacillus sp. BR2-3 TaxID=3048494 RepID=UPI0039772800
MKQTTIRAELEDFLKRKVTTINQFAEASGVNSGTISNIINGNRPIAMQQLDRITEGMGLVPGFFYELYADECFIGSTPNWRRLRPFLYRCAELDKLDNIRWVVSMMMDNLSYASVLFETAETFFKEGKHKAAVLLYENVAEGEKYQHSERLALCRYRLFTAALGNDQDVNLRAAVHFESFVDRLDEVDQLDALKDLANTYSSLHRWDKVEELAKRMGCKASIQYANRHVEARRDGFQKEPAMPLFSYILYSYVLCSVVYGELGDYDRALHYVSLYSDMSWIQENNEEVLQLMNQCMGWAKANTSLFKLLKGESRVLPEYVSYIEQRKDEILPALFKILQAANQHHFNVDDILLRFEQEISSYRNQQGTIGTYNEQVIADGYCHFMAELASYYFNQGKYGNGVKCIIDSLGVSVKINNEACIIRCVGLFEQFRYAATPEAQKQYQNLISEVQRRNEKKTGFVVGVI